MRRLAQRESERVFIVNTVEPIAVIVDLDEGAVSRR